jgi:hypothetical protein
MGIRPIKLNLQSGGFLMTRFISILCVLAFATAAVAAPCIFEAKSGKYKKCHHESMGKCHHYGSTCKPAM